MKHIPFLAIMTSLAMLIPACSNQQVPVAFVQPTTYPATQVAEYFPLAKGAYWIYEGDVKWQEGTSVIEKRMRWKMEVVDVIERVNATAFRMQGAPWDLAWYENGKGPSDYVFIKVGATRFYQGTDKEWARLLDQKDFLMQLVNDNMLFLEIPLVEGERYCDTMQITRGDPFYCWNVRAQPDVELTGIQGLDVREPLAQFIIGQGTNADFSGFNFVPGVGITEYQYVHHGTVSDVDVRLVEYHAGE